MKNWEELLPYIIVGFVATCIVTFFFAVAWFFIFKESTVATFFGVLNPLGSVFSKYFNKIPFGWGWFEAIITFIGEWLVLIVVAIGAANKK